jgi:hypothetical protein
VLKITLDTNSVRPERLTAASSKIRGGVDIATTTTVAREIGSMYDPELHQLQIVPELLVMGESPMGMAALASEGERALFEATLVAITNGSFPSRENRSTLTQGKRNQLRDAMIFCTHLREGRDIFVSDDVKAFGRDGSPQRERMSALAPRTKIMTLAEFEPLLRRATSVTLIAELGAFLQEHRRCGDLDGAVEGDQVWMTYTCGAAISRSADDD